MITRHPTSDSTAAPADFRADETHRSPTHEEAEASVPEPLQVFRLCLQECILLRNFFGRYAVKAWKINQHADQGRHGQEMRGFRAGQGWATKSGMTFDSIL